MQFTQSTMEEVLLRFPHLSEDIFNALDNKTFAICKEVSKVRYSYIDDRKRKVKVIKKIIEKCQLVFHHRYFQSIRILLTTCCTRVVEQNLMKSKPPESQWA